MIVFFGILVCTVLLGAIVYRYDLYDKEPWYLLLFVMALGFVVFWSIGFIEDFSNSRLGFYEAGDHTAGQAAVAATHEELAKLLVVVTMALLFRKHFNDPIDGLIYGAFAGLGMAVEESVFYMQHSTAAPGFDVFGQEVIRLVLHILMGGTSGFGVGLIVEHSKLKHWVLVLFAFLAASMTIHFLWDYLCGIPTATGGITPENEMFLRVTSVLLMLTAMSTFALAVKIGSHLSRHRFAPTSTVRLWGGSLFRR